MKGLKLSTIVAFITCVISSTASTASDGAVSYIGDHFLDEGTDMFFVDPVLNLGADELNKLLGRESSPGKVDGDLEKMSQQINQNIQQSYKALKKDDEKIAGLITGGFTGQDGVELANAINSVQGIMNNMGVQWGQQQIDQRGLNPQIKYIAENAISVFCDQPSLSSSANSPDKRFFYLKENQPKIYQEIENYLLPLPGQVDPKWPTQAQLGNAQKFLSQINGKAGSLLLTYLGENEKNLIVSLQNNFPQGVKSNSNMFDVIYAYDTRLLNLAGAVSVTTEFVYQLEIMQTQLYFLGFVKSLPSVSILPPVGSSDSNVPADSNCEAYQTALSKLKNDYYSQIKEVGQQFRSYFYSDYDPSIVDYGFKQVRYMNQMPGGTQNGQSLSRGPAGAFQWNNRCFAFQYYDLKAKSSQIGAYNGTELTAYCPEPKSPLPSLTLMTVALEGEYAPLLQCSVGSVEKYCQAFDTLNSVDDQNSSNYAVTALATENAEIYAATLGGQLMQCSADKLNSCTVLGNVGYVNTLAISNGFIFAGNSDGQLVQCSTDKSNSCVVLDTAEAPIRSLAIDQGAIYVGTKVKKWTNTGNGQVLKCSTDKSNSCKAFNMDIVANAGINELAVSDGYVYAGTDQAELVKCSADISKPCTLLPVDQGNILSINALVVDNGFIYIGANTTVLQCSVKESSSCTTLGSVMTNNPINFLAINRGVVYAGASSILSQCPINKKNACTTLLNYGGLANFDVSNLAILPGLQGYYTKQKVDLKQCNQADTDIPISPTNVKLRCAQPKPRQDNLTGLVCRGSYQISQKPVIDDKYNIYLESVPPLVQYITLINGDNHLFAQTPAQGSSYSTDWWNGSGKDSFNAQAQILTTLGDFGKFTLSGYSNYDASPSSDPDVVVADINGAFNSLCCPPKEECISPTTEDNSNAFTSISLFGYCNITLNGYAENSTTSSQGTQRGYLHICD